MTSEVIKSQHGFLRYEAMFVRAWVPDTDRVHTSKPNTRSFMLAKMCLLLSAELHLR